MKHQQCCKDQQKGVTSCKFLRVIGFCSRKRSMTFMVRKRVSGMSCKCKHT